MDALEVSNPFAELGDGDGFEDFDNGIADLFHDAADAALFLVGTGAAFVETFADASDGSERALDEANDFGEVNFFWRQAKAITACDAAAAFENAGGF